MIIQFSHNGSQMNITPRSKKNESSYLFDTESSGIRFWNDEESHKRKFLSTRSCFIKNMGDCFDTTPICSEAQFWGEWEAQSEFSLTGNGYSTGNCLPHAIHKPFYEFNKVGRHNTDPFIFGSHFYYTNCKQKNKGAGKKMLQLTAGSIVVFGSEFDKSDFMIDTVFVVDEHSSMFDYRNNPLDYPQALQDVTLNLNGGLSNWHMLYKGKMFNQSSLFNPELSTPFSFVPLKIQHEGKGFERPVLDWKRFGFKKPGSGTVLHTVSGSESDFWRGIVFEMLRQGYSLGVKFDMPKRRGGQEHSGSGRDSKC